MRPGHTIAWGAIAAALLAACGSGVTPEEQALQDERDIA